MQSHAGVVTRLRRFSPRRRGPALVTRTFLPCENPREKNMRLCASSPSRGAPSLSAERSSGTSCANCSRADSSFEDYGMIVGPLPPSRSTEKLSPALPAPPLPPSPPPPPSPPFPPAPTSLVQVLCPSTVDLTGCDSSFAKASLKIDESRPGKEKVQASLGSGAALTHPAIGDYTSDSGATAALCVYDSSSALVGVFHVEDGGLSGDVPCWKSTGGDYPGGKECLTRTRQRR
jgi:hypothetical protein